MNTDVYQTLKKFIITSKSLDEEEKTNYLKVADDLSQGKIDDLEAAEELNQYLDDEFTLLEDSAIADEDAELISDLADLRNARLELEKQILGVSEA